jgi:hypothetical protein
MKAIEHFERCWPWLAAALEHAGNTHSKEQVLAAFKDGSAYFHPLPHGAMSTYFQTHPSGLRDQVFWLAGGDLGEICKGVELLTRWAREEKCDRSVIYGRKGWVKKLPDFRIGGSILIRKLK